MLLYIFCLESVHSSGTVTNQDSFRALENINRYLIIVSASNYFKSCSVMCWRRSLVSRQLKMVALSSTISPAV